MNKHLRLLALFFCFNITLSYAQTAISNCAASPDPIIIDNGGQPLTILGKGSQLNSWTETTDGFIIKQNSSHVFEYVVKNKEGKFIPSGTKATNRSLATRARSSFIKNTKEDIAALAVQNTYENGPMSLSSISGATIEVFTNTAMPTKGSIKVLCLLVEYPDLGNSFSKNDFQNLLNQPNYNGTGSFKDYFADASFDSLDLTVDVVDWVMAPNNFEYYGNANGRARELVRFAVDQAELSGLDFSQYDNDGDGDVDGIMVVHAGQGAEEGGQNQYIWSHSWSIPTVEYDGVSINAYIINPETRASSAMTGIGVFCHEFGHNIGLPDLYDTDGSSQGIGNWGLMGSASWLGGGHKPGSPTAWSKIKMGWQVPVEITGNGTYTLNPSATNQEIYMIDPGEGKEYFLLENRQKLGLDQALPGTGLTIWHIDDAKYSNSDETHKRVDVEEADGLNELDNSSRGDAGDLYPGTSGNTVFNGFSDPNNQLYGVGINPARILNIVQNPDKTITFDTDFDNVKFTPFDTISFLTTVTGKSNEKNFSIKAYNYDFTITSIVYADGFSGSLSIGDVVTKGTHSTYSLFFNPTTAKEYKGNVAITGVSNGVTINGSIKLKGIGLQLLFADDFETDIGWTFNGFEIGVPQGLGGDPTVAIEGTNVLGNVLGGTGVYNNNLTDREWTATSSSFNLYGYSNINLNFQQWLNLSGLNEDFAYLDVSIDGGLTWKQIIGYGDWEIIQTSWWNVFRDISDYVAWEEDVKIRFSLGKTDVTNVSGGWNIDDLTITGTAEAYQLEANLNYGPTGIGVNKSKDLTVKNGASNNFTVTNVTIPLGYSTDLTVGSVIGNGSSGTFNIQFAPLLKQAYDGTLVVEFTDGITSYTDSVSITGRGDYMIFYDDFETNKGWSLTGGFEIGTPLGRGYDPFTAASGVNVLGTVLTGSGRYEDNLTDRQWIAESPVINCTAFTNVNLNFARFNQIDGYYDSAYVDVSIDGGASWTNVWRTEGRWTGDWQWESQTIDISALADGQSVVAIRYTMGPTNDTWTYAGWNIDDVSLTGDTNVAINVTDSLNYGDVIVGASSSLNIQIKNVGIQDLIVTGINYPPDFTGENYAGTLASGATKIISVDFNPVEAKMYTGQIEVGSNAAAGSNKVAVQGRGLGAEIKVVAAFNFGDVFLDSTATASIYLVNQGNVDLNVTDVTYSEGTFSGSWSGLIGAKDSVELFLQFKPTLEKLYTATLQVNSDALLGAGTTSLTGTGIVLAKHIQISASSLDFGSVDIDSLKIISVDIINSANTELVVSSISSNNSKFTTDWSNSVIAVGQSKTLQVLFIPNQRINYSGQLVISSDAAEGDQLISLAGIGVLNQIQVSGTIDFGTVEIGKIKTDTFTIENLGDVSIDISGITYSDAVLSGNWIGQLAPGASKDIEVSFAPTEEKEYIVEINMLHNATLGNVSQSATGIGVLPPKHIQISVELLDFGKVDLDSIKTVVVDVINIGTTELSILNVASNNLNFTADWDNSVIAAGQSKELLISFSPAERINYSGQLLITSDAVEGVQSIDLAGIGVLNQIQVSGEIDFGTVEVGEIKMDTFTIENIGDVTIDISGITYSDAVLSGNWIGQLAAGASQDVVVSFTPTEVKEYTVEVNVLHNAGSGIDTLTVKGTSIDVIAGVENDFENLSFYPNPTKNIIKINGIQSRIETYFVVINNVGKEMRRGLLESEINLSGFPNGLYTIKLTSSNSDIILKVVLQK